MSLNDLMRCCSSIFASSSPFTSTGRSKSRTSVFSAGDAASSSEDDFLSSVTASEGLASSDFVSLSSAASVSSSLLAAAEAALKGLASAKEEKPEEAKADPDAASEAALKGLASAKEEKPEEENAPAAAAPVVAVVGGGLDTVASATILPKAPPVSNTPEKEEEGAAVEETQPKAMARGEVVEGLLFLEGAEEGGEEEGEVGGTYSGGGG